MIFLPNMDPERGTSCYVTVNECTSISGMSIYKDNLSVMVFANFCLNPPLISGGYVKKTKRPKSFKNINFEHPFG